MTDLQRNYTIPLRREFLKAPRYRRAKKAIKATKEFILKHMKVKEVKLHKELNEFIMSRGRQNPPGKVKVTAIKKGDVCRVNLEGFKIEEPKKKTEEKSKEAPKEELTKVEEQKKKEDVVKQEVLHKKK